MAKGRDLNRDEKDSYRESCRRRDHDAQMDETRLGTDEIKNEVKNVKRVVEDVQDEMRQGHEDLQNKFEDVQQKLDKLNSAMTDDSDLD